MSKDRDGILKRWRNRLSIRRRLLDTAERQFEYWRVRWRQAKLWNLSREERSRRWQMMADRAAKVRKRKEQVAYAERVIDRHSSLLRIRAYEEASKLVGIMEHGGNNRGADVEKIIRAAGGRPGDAWCGWFVSYCYSRAGSKLPDWRWGAVRLYLPFSGLKRTTAPRKGDLVRFTFDHIGIFVADHGAYIETIEGNTGATGAVSDSRHGGDGVYRKRRHKSLIRDYIRVTR